MNKIVASYARFSTQRQNEESIAAQEDACRRYAAHRTWSVDKQFSDEARSGQDSFRHGFLALQQAIRGAEVKAVIVNSIDRLSRRAADLHAFHDLCKFHQVTVHVVELNGELSDLHIGFEGIISQQYIEGIRHKTRTGLRRVVEQGGWGGGRAYGYRIVYAEDGERSLIIDGEQAAVVREIFELYRSGISPRRIAAMLNARGLHSPRGKNWTSSTIIGNNARQNGILNNRLYIGEYVWNRQRHIKNPDTSKRTSRANDTDEHVIVSRPELQIVEEALWSAVKSEQVRRLTEMQATFGPNAFGGARRKKYLLTGLVKCARCGGDYISQGRARWACGNHRDRGTCKNAQGFRIEHLEHLLFETIRADLLTPEVIQEVSDAVRKQLQELHRTSRDRKHKIERELRDIDSRLANIVSAIGAGAFSEALKTELARLEDRKLVLQADHDALPGSETVVVLPGNYGQLYQSRISKLAALFEAPEAGQAREHIRSLIDKIVVHPTKRGQSPEFEIHGSLAGILAFAYGKEESPGTGCSEASLPPFAVSMVAGVGFEPTTFRL